MTQGKLESKDLWTRVEGHLELFENGLRISPAGSHRHTWETALLDFGRAMIELKAQQTRQGKLLARQAMESVDD